MHCPTTFKNLRIVDMSCSNKIQRIRRSISSRSVPGASGVFASGCIIGHLVPQSRKAFSGFGLEAMLSMTGSLANMLQRVRLISESLGFDLDAEAREDLLQAKKDREAGRKDTYIELVSL